MTKQTGCTLYHFIQLSTTAQELQVVCLHKGHFTVDMIEEKGDTNLIQMVNCLRASWISSSASSKAIKYALLASEDLSQSIGVVATIMVTDLKMSVPAAIELIGFSYRIIHN